MSSPFHQVNEFHKFFEFPLPATPQLVDDEIFRSRVKFLGEELTELQDAHAIGDQVGVLDAVLDLIYVAIGTGLYAGLTPEELSSGFNAVHAANMAKVKVASAKESKRGTPYDAKKPEGWVGPERALSRLIMRRGG